MSAWLITPFAPLTTAYSYNHIQPDDLIIAVDGGLIRCNELKLSPHVLIGDFDSLPEDALSSLSDACLRIQHPTAKNETDTQLAVEYCIERNIKTVYICNDMTVRFDHALALCQNLLQAFHNGVEAFLVSASQIITVMGGEVSLSYPVGSLISLIAITDDVYFATSTGLEYPLDDLQLYPWQSRGISNVITATPTTISIAKGLVYCIVTPF